MMNSYDLYAIIWIFLIHFVADFVLQPHKWASTKAHNMASLTKHVGVYAGCYAVVGWTFLPYAQMWVFVIVTFVLHWITDFFTSKFTSHYFGKKDYHNGFVIVGLDQFLHACQLLITFHVLR